MIPSPCRDNCRPLVQRVSVSVDVRERDEMASNCKSEVEAAVSTRLSAGMQVEQPPTLSCVEMPNPTTANIFRVPPHYRHIDPADFSPQRVSIGPYHHGGSANNQAIKRQYLRDLILRIDGQNISACLDKYIQIACRRLEEVKKQYVDEIKHSDVALVEMLVADGCFIVEFLIKWYLNDQALKTASMKQILPMLRTDLLLVENQLPFFILEDFFAASHVPDLVNDPIGLVELALFYLSGGDRTGAQVAAEYYRTSEHYSAIKVHHLLHLYHLMCLEPHFVKQVNVLSTKMHIQKLLGRSFSSLPLLLVCSFAWFLLRLIHKAHFLLSKILWSTKLPEFYVLLLRILASKSGLITRSGQDLSVGIPNASYLRDTGFNFKKKDPLSSFSYVTREGNTIGIPELSVGTTPLVLLRNLIMFELCPLSQSDSIAGYAKLMEYLIDTAEDVAVLREFGIIDKRFGDDETVARIFNASLCKDTCLNDDHYLKEMFKDVREYYDRSYYQVKFYQWRKKLIPDYFSNPWAVPSMIAAFVVLALPVLSTFFTVYSYYHQRNHINAPCCKC